MGSPARWPEILPRITLRSMPCIRAATPGWRDAVPEGSKERYRQMAKAEAESKGLPYVEMPDSAGDPGNNAPKAVYLCTEAAGISPAR